MQTPSLLRQTLGTVALLAALLPAAHAAPTPLAAPPVLANGLRVDWVQVGQAPHSLTDAIHALNGTGGFAVLDSATQYLQTIDLHDASAPFAGADPYFAVRVSGFITLEAGDYSFLSTHDDGIRVSVGGETVLEYASDTADRQTDSPFYTLAAGVYAYEAIGWEQGGVFTFALGLDDRQTRGFLAGQHAAAVPEPSSLALLSLGLLGLSLSHRTRQRAG